mgnify:CR=1 FL=1
MLENKGLRECTMLHWYSVEGVLGQGAFGITYKGTDTNLQKSVAIKEYCPRGYLSLIHI